MRNKSKSGQIGYREATYRPEALAESADDKINIALDARVFTNATAVFCRESRANELHRL